METTITDYTKSCQLCQKVKGNQSKQTHQLSITASDLPFKKVAMDHFSPLSKTENGNVYVLLVIDMMFSRYVKVFPVASLLPMELAQALYNNYILRHGVPEQVLLDNGSTFTSEFNKQLAELCGMELQFTPAYHQASNGMVEKFMATLRQMILIYCQEETIATKWDQHLRLLRFVYNNTYHASIQTSPFELVRGRLARTPPLIQNQEVKLPPLYRNSVTPQRHFFCRLFGEQFRISFSSGDGGKKNTYC